MIVNDIVTGAIAIIAGYLLGSIPSAYIFTRLATGRDIRRLGGGNVGGLNVFREVGAIPALCVGIVDIGKGAAAVAIAFYLLRVSMPLVLAAGLAAVIGHNWMVWLRFDGGKGMGPTIGGLSLLMPLYGYPQGLIPFFVIILILLVITHNVALSMAGAIFSLPFIAWLGMKSGVFIVWSVVLAIVIIIRFLPTARAALAKSRTAGDFIFDRRQRDRDKKEDE